jgi:hypothetical protein
MKLNDMATDEQRQQLLPFVARLACADTPEVERERQDYIARRLRHRLRYPLTFQEKLDILEGALAIGRQADMLAPAEVTTRLQAVQQSAPTPATASTTAASFSKLAKLKAWFAPAA